MFPADPPVTGRARNVTLRFKEDGATIQRAGVAGRVPRKHRGRAFAWKRIGLMLALLAPTGLALVSDPVLAMNVFINDNHGLNAGSSMSTGTGCSLTVQSSDGNLVEYCNGAVHWQAQTYPYPADYLIMQSDGNGVVYTSANHPIWSTDTYGSSDASLVLQDDQNLVVYNTSGTAIWAVSWEQTSGGAQQFAQYIFVHYGWSVSSQWSCLYNLWQRESGWAWNADNPSSGAYGIPQSLPGNKMAAAGTDWQIGGLTQVHWGEDYISTSYGSPCSAWSHEQTYGWY